MALVDVVVVSYNSRDRLRRCVSPLVGDPDFHVVVVDNASPVESLSVLDGLELTVPLPGRFNVLNALGAVAAARVLDVPEEGIRREGAILERETFEVVASRLRAEYSWS